MQPVVVKIDTQAKGATIGFCVSVVFIGFSFLYL